MAGSKKISSAIPKTKSATVSRKKIVVSHDYGESLVGSRLKVWWPMDKEFYAGVIKSFDATKKKHQVKYDDGDTEKLNLNKERWEMIEDEDNAEADEEDSGNESSEEAPEPKKAKANGKVSQKGRKDTAVPKKKETIAPPAKSKGKAKAGKKADTEKPENGKMGDVGGKIVAAASRMSVRSKKLENGAAAIETSKSVKTGKKISEVNNAKRKAQPSEAVSKNAKKPRTSSRVTRSSNNTAADEEEKLSADDVEEDVSAGDDENASEDDYKPIVNLVTKAPKVKDAKKKEKGKKKEETEEASGNEEDADVEEEAEAEEEEDEAEAEEKEEEAEEEAEAEEKEEEAEEEAEAEAERRVISSNRQK